MDTLDILIILGSGLFAGFLNTVAGGGSLLTLPVLIFMGLDSSVANATNRVAIFSQNAFATGGFISKRVSVFPFNVYLGISALAGALIGAKIAIDISDSLFKRILAIVMLAVIFWTVSEPYLRKQNKGKNMTERLTGLPFWLAIGAFFFIGMYGGFIQAGTGFLIIAALSMINRLDLVRTNSVKVVVVLIYTSAALLVFIIEGKVDWAYGLILAVGNSTGGWIGSRWQVKSGEKWVRRILVVTVIAMAVKLWFF